MAATKTVAHRPRLRKSGVPEILTANPKLSIKPRHGVITLFGYGIQVRVDSGHLILKDGIGADRRYARLPRVGHNLRRLVIIGADGMVSLAALRWLADQDAAFVMLERDGSVLATTGPVRSSDVRLRRAQALSPYSGAALRITQELISQKLTGQENVARYKLRDSGAADAIAYCHSQLATANTVQAARLIESQAGAAYWAAWQSLPIMFPKIDLPRVPEHWRVFGARRSPISGSARLAANPVNAMLNYGYAVLEAEANFAVTALGLDPGLAFLHSDTAARDSLACDLMEPVRPLVDSYVLDWITRMPLKREWFFEERDGNCRLMASLASQLSETATTWGSAVAPLAEWVVRTLWATTIKPVRQERPATRLTQSHKREAKGAPVLPSPAREPRRQNLCRGCGVPITPEGTHCATCAVAPSIARLKDIARSGRVVAQSAKAQASRSASQRRHAAGRKSWSPSDQPAWLTETAYRETIQPLLPGVPNAAIVNALGVSIPYAVNIRHGKRVPHPRHWAKLAEVVGAAEAAQFADRRPA
jgi:CRISPR-associated endonuclease Cas1